MFFFFFFFSVVVVVVVVFSFLFIFLVIYFFICPYNYIHIQSAVLLTIIVLGYVSFSVRDNTICDSVL